MQYGFFFSFRFCFLKTFLMVLELKQCFFLLDYVGAHTGLVVV